MCIKCKVEISIQYAALVTVPSAVRECAHKRNLEEKRFQLDHGSKPLPANVRKLRQQKFEAADHVTSIVKQQKEIHLQLFSGHSLLILSSILPIPYHTRWFHPQKTALLTPIKPIKITSAKDWLISHLMQHLVLAIKI